MLTKDDGSKILVCEECHEKIKEQENPKCKECSLAPNLPYFKCNYPNDQSIYCLHPSNCWAKVEKDFRDYGTGAGHKHLTFVKAQEDLKNIAEAMVKWDEEKNAWVYLFRDDEIVWQPPQEEKQGNYVRKYSAMNANCCGGNCKKKLDDEAVEKDTMTCAKCKTEFSQGYAVHSPDVFFCEKCGQENHADGEFKVWIEAIGQKEPRQEQPTPQENPPTNRERNKPQQETRNCETCGKKSAELITLSTRSGYNGKGICGECEKSLPDDKRKGSAFACVKCGKVGNWKTNFCQRCSDNERQKNLNVPNEYTCERCNTSCWNERKGVYTIRRIWQTDLNFREEVHYFSENCSCAEEFKRQHQQTCAQCQKREWPDMKKGWALDYGLKTIFCSPMCHYKYHKNLWEQEQRERNRGLQSYTPGDVPNATVLSWLEKTKLYPMELELSSGDDKSSKDKTTTGKVTSKAELEKLASKKEILTLKEFSKALKKESLKSATDPKLSKEEKQMANYFLKLAESSEAKAEADFESKYGKAELNSLLTGSNQEQPKKNYWPLIIGGGLVVAGIVGVVVYFLWSKSNSKKK